MKLMSPLVDASWEDTGFLSFISGSMAFASCLPNSTPHWSYELISQMHP